MSGKITVMAHHDTDGDINLYVETGDTDVREQLYEYVCSRWHEDDEYIDGHPWSVAGPIPTNKAEAVKLYFETYDDERIIVKEFQS